jgi:hypothetical protein
MQLHTLSLLFLLMATLLLPWNFGTEVKSIPESECYVTTDGKPASLSWTKAPIWGLTTRSLLLSDSCGFVDLGRPLWREGGSVVCNCYWSSPAQSFSGPIPVGLVAMFYCLRFETSLFVASYDSQGHGGGIRPHLHTGFRSLFPFPYFLISSRHGPRTENIGLLFRSADHTENKSRDNYLASSLARWLLPSNEL